MYHEHLLPPGARLVHIGPPKTGTTAIQHAFDAVRPRLREHGVHYAPGDESRPRAAVVELLRSASPARDGAWDGLVGEIRDAGQARVCVSNEMLARCDDSRAARLVADIGPEQTHVVMVARPLAKLLPSQWQQRVRKQARMISYDAWLRVVLADDADDPHHDHFWRLHDLAAQTRRWTSVTGPDRVVIAVADETDREFLPRLFEGLLGLPEGLLVPPSSRTNRSLDFSEAELMRALDEEAHRAGWSPRLYQDGVKPAMSKLLRHGARGEGDPITLPAWAIDRVAELDERRIRLLQESPARVIGSPERLRGESVSADVDERVPITTAVRFTAAAMESMARREQSLRRRLRRAEARPHRPEPRAPLDEVGGRELARALVSRAVRRVRR